MAERRRSGGYEDGYVEKNKAVEDMVDYIFAEDRDIILDTSTIYVLEHHIKNNDKDIGKLDKNIIDNAHIFTCELINKINENRDRILMFPELRTEYHGNFDRTWITIDKAVTKKDPSANKYSQTELEQIRGMLDSYKEKMLELDSLSKEYESRAGYHDIADKLTDVLVYLKKKILDKEELKNVDEKAIAYGILNAIQGRPTNIYTRDKPMMQVAEIAFTFLASPTVIRRMTQPHSKQFLCKLKKSEVYVYFYNSEEQIFTPDIDNPSLKDKDRLYALPNGTGKLLKEICDEIEPILNQIEKDLQELGKDESAGKFVGAEADIAALLQDYPITKELLYRVQTTQERMTRYEALEKICLRLGMRNQKTYKIYDAVMNGKKILEARLNIYGKIEEQKKKHEKLKELQDREPTEELLEQLDTAHNAYRQISKEIIKYKNLLYPYGFEFKTEPKKPVPVDVVKEQTRKPGKTKWILQEILSERKYVLPTKIPEDILAELTGRTVGELNIYLHRVSKRQNIEFVRFDKKIQINEENISFIRIKGKSRGKKKS
jgi:hypothetical protein